MKRWNIINRFITMCGYRSYLEVGIGSRRNWSLIKCHHKIGVDPNPVCEATYTMKSDDFFALNDSQFDIVFIDGLHIADQLERDIKNALKVLSPGGTIVCHDINPMKEMFALPHRTSKIWNGDCWKAWVKLRQRADLAMYVINADHGCGIIQEGPQHPVVIYCALTWNNLIRNRGYWLNLVTKNDFLEMTQPKHKKLGVQSKIRPILL